MGSLQALEVQKVLLVKALQNPDRYPAEIRDILSNHVDVGSIQPCVGKMLVFSALDLQFRKVTLRPRLKACAVCGESPAIRDVLSTQYGVQRELCEAPRPVLPTIPEEASVDATVLRSLPSSACLVDVRSPLQFAGVHLPSAINVPYSNLMRKDDKSIETLRSLAARYDKLFVMCRRGNDSVRTVALCFELGISNVVNIRGGLAAYAAACDPTMPVI
jgi:rhodanese-related sulfurtransferase